MKYNCPNCGAVVEPDICKCPYCGVQYLDISHIDFDEKVPIVLKLKVGKGDEATYVTQLVLPTVDLDVHYYYEEATDQHGRKLMQSRNGTHITTNYCFVAIPMYDKSMAIVENKEVKIVWK